MKLTNVGKAYKSLVSIPAWQQRLLSDSGDFSDNIDSVPTAYANVPMIYRAVKMRADALASVPITFYAGENEIEWLFPCDIHDLVWNIEADMLGSGKAVILKLRNKLRVLDLQRLNPFTVDVKANVNDGVLSMVFNQGGTSWSQGDIIYLKEFSYSDDLTSGISTVHVCLNDAALMNWQTRFASKFFESGGQPIIIGSFDGVVSDDEVESVQKKVNAKMTGIARAWSWIITRTKINTEVVSQELDKMSMPELYKQATSNIANAFGIPVNMFSGDDNYASADSHRMQFWQDTVRPRGRMIENAINRQLLNPLKMRMEFNFDELDIFQVDEAQRAQSFSIYVNAGVNPLVAKEMLGIEANSDLPFMAIDAAPEPEVEENNKPVIDMPNQDMAEEMVRWQRKSLKRLKDGKSADCEFDSDIIPDVVQDSIHNALKFCVDAGEIRRVFDGEYNSPRDLGLYQELVRANDLMERSLMDKPEINVTVNTGGADESKTQPV